MHPLYEDRGHAGRFLAERIAARLSETDHNPLVLGLPRGGVAVAYEVARRLGLPLDVFIVRKLGAPGQPELALGAIASGGGRVLNTEYLTALGVSADELEEITRLESAELNRREALYRSGRTPLNVCGRTVVVVDDGLATGATMRAAAEALRLNGAARILIAVPVGAADVVQQLRADGFETICPASPEPFHGVGRWYERFDQTSDAEVRRLLACAQGQPEESSNRQAVRIVSSD